MQRIHPKIKMLQRVVKFDFLFDPVLFVFGRHHIKMKKSIFNTDQDGLCGVEFEFKMSSLKKQMYGSFTGLFKYDKTKFKLSFSPL